MDPISSATQERIDMAEYQRDGFVIVRVLDGAELAACRAAADEVASRPEFRSVQHHYVNVLTPRGQHAALQAVYHHARAMSVAEQIVGGPLVLDGGAVLLAPPGAVYHQGWHRDVLQLPEELVTDDYFTNRWRHNSVQINLALADDDVALWAVPGSHARPDTAAERAAFGGSRHQSPPGAQMPGARCMKLSAGEAVFYNNNLIHRGYCDFVSPRRTLHFGYHCAKYPPTWHFHHPIEAERDPAFVASLTPDVRRLLERRVERAAEYPDVKTSYRAGFDN